MRAHLGWSSASQNAGNKARRPAKKVFSANTTAATAGLSAQRTGADRADRGDVPGRGVEKLDAIIGRFGRLRRSSALSMFINIRSESYKVDPTDKRTGP